MHPCQQRGSKGARKGCKERCIDSLISWRRNDMVGGNLRGLSLPAGRKKEENQEEAENGKEKKHRKR